MSNNLQLNNCRQPIRYNDHMDFRKKIIILIKYFEIW